MDLEALGFEVETLDPAARRRSGLFYEDTSPTDTGELSTRLHGSCAGHDWWDLAFVIVWWYLSKHSPARRAYFRYISLPVCWDGRYAHLTPAEYAGILAKAAQAEPSGLSCEILR